MVNDAGRLESGKGCHLAYRENAETGNILSMNRFLKAVLQAVLAFFLAGITSCVALTIAVSDSHDGQAGMGAALGGFYIAFIAAILTLFISLWRSSPYKNRLWRGSPYRKSCAYGRPRWKARLMQVRNSSAMPI
jgi:Zn-dependent protease with chaperone function